MGLTPCYLFTAKTSELSKRTRFGSECYAQKYEQNKLDTRGQKGILVGQDKNSPVYVLSRHRESSEKQAGPVRPKEQHTQMKTWRSTLSTERGLEPTDQKLT